jgi:hypothetical protein
MSLFLSGSQGRDPNPKYTKNPDPNPDPWSAKLDSLVPVEHAVCHIVRHEDGGVGIIAPHRGVNTAPLLILPLILSQRILEIIGIYVFAKIGITEKA